MSRVSGASTPKAHTPVLLINGDLEFAQQTRAYIPRPVLLHRTKIGKLDVGSYELVFANCQDAVKRGCADLRGPRRRAGHADDLRFAREGKLVLHLC